MVVEVLGPDTVQMSLVEHDDMIQTIAAYAADHPFGDVVAQQGQFGYDPRRTCAS